MIGFVLGAVLGALAGAQSLHLWRRKHPAPVVLSLDTKVTLAPTPGFVLAPSNPVLWVRSINHQRDLVGPATATVELEDASTRMLAFHERLGSALQQERRGGWGRFIRGEAKPQPPDLDAFGRTPDLDTFRRLPPISIRREDLMISRPNPVDVARAEMKRNLKDQSPSDHGQPSVPPQRKGEHDEG